MTFVTHLKVCSGGSYREVKKPCRRSFPVFTLPANPTLEMVEVAQQYIAARSGAEIDVYDLLSQVFNCQRGNLL